MLFLEVAAELAPQVALVSSLLVLLTVLISCFSAKRFNFLHGMIVFFTLTSLLVGVDKILIAKDLVNTNEIAKQVSLYFTAFSGLLDPIYGALIDFLKGQAFYPQIEAYTQYIYFAPIALWFVSRIFAGIIRRNRRGY